MRDFRLADKLDKVHIVLRCHAQIFLTIELKLGEKEKSMAGPQKRRRVSCTRDHTEVQ